MWKIEFSETGATWLGVGKPMENKREALDWAFEYLFNLVIEAKDVVALKAWGGIYRQNALMDGFDGWAFKSDLGSAYIRVSEKGNPNVQD